MTVCLRTWGEAEKGKADGVGKWEKGKLCIARSRCCLSRPHKRELVKIHGALEPRATGSPHDFIWFVAEPHISFELLILPGNRNHDSY